MDTSDLSPWLCSNAVPADTKSSTASSHCNRGCSRGCTALSSVSAFFES